MADVTVYFQVEERYPPGQPTAFSVWRPYYGEGYPWLCQGEDNARATYRRLLVVGRQVRLVRVTQEVIE